jgi:hypothetical protein
MNPPQLSPERRVAESKPHRTALLLWVLGPVFELPLVAMLTITSPDVRDAAPLGSPGTAIVASTALAMVLIGAVVASTTRHVRTALRRMLTIGLAVTAGVLGFLTLGFLIDSAWVVLGVLLAHSTLATGFFCAAFVRPPAR